MFRRHRTIRVLAHLLVFAISFAQISVAAAMSVDLNPDTKGFGSSMHTQHNDHTSMADMTKSDCPHMEKQAEKSDCCQSSECAEKACADNACVTSANSVSSAVFNSQTRIANRDYRKSKIEIHNQLQSGISPTSLYRPPR